MPSAAVQPAEGPKTRAWAKAHGQVSPVDQRRPRTRAWVKANPLFAIEVQPKKATTTGRKSRGVQNKEAVQKAKSHVPRKHEHCGTQVEVQPLTFLGAKDHQQQSKSPSDTHRRDYERADTNPTAVEDWTPNQIAAWLRDLPKSPFSDTPNEGVKIPTSLYEPTEDEMNFTSVSRRDLRDSMVTETTTKTVSRQAGKVTMKKMECRNVFKDKSPNDRLPFFSSMLDSPLLPTRMCEVSDLGIAAREFFERTQTHGSEACNEFIEELQLKIDATKAEIHHPLIPRAYFDAFVQACISQNEAVVQRTVLMSLFNHHWLPSMIKWNAEGIWIQNRANRLPSTQLDVLSSPKPDLSFSFAKSAFTGDNNEHSNAPIPSELQSCLSPDSARGDDRYFPFIFIEAKKYANDLADAELTNLHTASQALYNIYQWMEAAQQTDSFFRSVRVFSIVLNAQNLGVRIHRGQLKNDVVTFPFDDVIPIGGCTRDKVCVFIDRLLHDYAIRELYETLLDTYRRVTQHECLFNKSKEKLLTVQADQAKHLWASENGL